jgi:hypothetical protein
MTIFLMVLQKLIKEQLNPRSTDLDEKSKPKAYSYRWYNHELSRELKTLIDDLSDNIVKFTSDEDDKSSVNYITTLIKDTRENVGKKREEHGEPKDKGETMECLNKLSFDVEGLYKKLIEFKKIGSLTFDLLDMKYTNNPLFLIYYHAVYYFGEEIFHPKSNLDVKLRAEKEVRLGKRLQSLSELIKPEQTLDEQKERALQVLADLANDNKQVIKKDKSYYKLPGLTLYGVGLSIPTDWFSPSEGRLGEQFNLAVRKINEMTLHDFEPIIKSSIKFEHLTHGSEETTDEQNEDEYAQNNFSTSI